MDVDDAGGVRLAALVRGRPSEAGAIGGLVLGAVLAPSGFAGGLLVVLWPIAAAVAASSRVWDRNDRLIGMIAPLTVSAIGVFALGAARARDDRVVDFAAFGGAFLHLGPWIFAASGLLGAGYLGWRLVRSVGARTLRLAGPEEI